VLDCYFHLKQGNAGNITIDVDGLVSFAGVDSFGGSSFASSSVQEVRLVEVEISLSGQTP